MTIEKTTDGSKLTLAVAGRLDTATSPDFEKEIKESVTDAVTSLDIDMKDLEYISSSGLRVLLSAQKMMNGKQGTLTILNPNEVVSEVFEVTGFSDILTIQ